MRSLAIATLAGLVAVSACSTSTTHHTATAAPRSVVATGNPPTQQSLPEGDVHNDDTTFHVKVASVRMQHSYTDGVVKPEVAKAGTVLIVVKLTEKNTGKQPSNIGFGTPNPVSLVGADGSTFQRGVDWASSDDINPGLTRDADVYTFDVPAGTKPASVIVTLLPQSGGSSSVDLALPR